MTQSVFDSPEFNHNLFFPRLDRSPAPAGAEDIYVPVAEGVDVHARRHGNPSARFSLVYFHGNGEIVADYDDLAPAFSALDAELIVCDYRGYGRSGGNPELRNALRDAHCILDHLKARDGMLKPQVAVMGRSLGSASVIELCSRRRDVSAMVVESGYADPIPLVARRGLRIDKTTEEEDAVFNNARKIASVTCPTLIMHGIDDWLISPAEALQNHEACGAKVKHLKMLEEVGHNDILESPEYFPTLRKFFDSVLSLSVR